MAAEESSQGATLGPDLSEDAGDPPTDSRFPDLHEVHGDFLVALCVIDVVSRALTELSEDAEEDVGSCALALKHGYELLDAVYDRFDEGLMGSSSSDDDQDDLDADRDGSDAGASQDDGRAIRTGLRTVWEILGAVPRARACLGELIDKLERRATSN